MSLGSYRNDGKYWPLNTKILVIVNHYDADVGWASQIEFPHLIYEKEMPSKEPFNAINRAKSETNLLKFIAEFYEDLPDNIITIHQYEHKFYHDGSLLQILNDPNFTHKYQQSITPGYLSFNNFILGDVYAQIPHMLSSGWWLATMEPWFGPIKEYGNFTAGKRGCAQFIVSKERIQSLPREFYANMYQWLVENTLEESYVGFNPITKCRLSSPIDYHPNSNWYTSRYMEWSWELIFTSWKPHENITVNINGHTFSARYGQHRYYRDVTTHLLKRLHNGKLEIPSVSDFNRIFGDVMVNTVKCLRIILDGNESVIPEDRMIVDLA